MTHQELISLIKDPGEIKPEFIPDLKHLVDTYPYFTPALLLYTKALQQVGDVRFEEMLNRSVLHVADRRWLYYYVNPLENPAERQKKPYVRPGKKSGDYFDIIETVEKEGGDVKESLAALAERLKKARLTIVAEDKSEKQENVVPSHRKVVIENKKDETITAIKQEENYVEKVKLLMREKKYVEALEILKELNLNNPKKSVYFADQIRFLEKIIENTKK